MDDCNYKFSFDKIYGIPLSVEPYRKVALHFLLHSDSLFVGSHDFLWWWKDCISKDCMGFSDTDIYEDGGKVWKRQCYNAFQTLQQEGYLKSYKHSNEISEDELSLYNKDLEKIHWRYYKKTEKFFNDFKNKIKNDYKISTYEMMKSQKSWYYKKKEVKKEEVKKVLTIEEIMQFLDAEHVYPEYISKESSELSALDKYTLSKIYKQLK